MRAEPWAYRWGVVLLGVALLSTNCARRASFPGGAPPSAPGAALRLSNDSEAGASPLQPLAFSPVVEPSEPERLHRRWGARGLGSEAPTMRLAEDAGGTVASEVLSPAPPTCGGLPVPPSWPDFSAASSEALLAPLFACTPAEFVALQQRVDMPRLVGRLDAWGAVRLGALGPAREDAAEALNRKRAAFLAAATREYGPLLAEVFALFVVHSCHDDDLAAVLGTLAREKQLTRTLGDMAYAQEYLRRRGFPLAHYPERPERPGDMLRGAGEGLGDMVSSSPLLQWGGPLEYDEHKRQLPEEYRQALLQREDSLVEGGLTSGHSALGVVDELTLGIPLGTWHLLAGTAQGLSSLARGQYEQGGRELTPAALMVTVYAGGKGLRHLAEGRRVPGGGNWLRSGLPGLEERLTALKEVARHLEAQLGGEGLRELTGYIRASREAGRFVAVGGPDAAVALHEAGGNVPKAQAWLSQAKSERPGSSGARGGVGKSPGGGASLVDEPAGSTPKKARVEKASGSLASLVDEQAGLTPEVVEAKLAAVELESTGARLPAKVEWLERNRSGVEAPPPGVPEGSGLWREYVAYRERRLTELRTGQRTEGPLRWKAYEHMRGLFARGLHFERIMVELLEADAALPRAQRRFLGDFNTPRIEKYVGVSKPGTGLRFADVLILEEGELAGRLPRVETLSFKSRDLSRLDAQALEAQMIADAKEALAKYGETLDIRRPSLQPLLGQGRKVPVSRVRLVYEGDVLKPKDLRELEAALNATKQQVPGVEVLFQ